jgi:hypothetical protein
MSKVNKITDGLGLGVDENIKETLASILLHGFKTSGSCEGHVCKNAKEQYGLSYPWVEFYMPEPTGWKKSKTKQLHWTTENLKQQRKILILLDKFYSNRKIDFESLLIFEAIGAFGAFRIRSMGSEIMSLYSRSKQRDMLKLYQKEMNDFGKFLKSIF